MLPRVACKERRERGGESERGERERERERERGDERINRHVIIATTTTT
jgi:hypothetical protein